jgi:hypothetical protein
MNETGRVEGSVLAELIRTPLFKDMLNNCLSEIDPERGAATARTIIWEDPQLILSLVATLPHMINWMVLFLGELGNQTCEKFPPELLKRFGVQIWEDIDKDAVKTCSITYGKMIEDILRASPKFQDNLLAALKGPVASATGRGINNAVKYVNEIQRQDPLFVKEVLSEVISNIEGKAFAEASASLVDATLDQKLPLISWGWNLIKSRIRRRFTRKI